MTIEQLIETKGLVGMLEFVGAALSHAAQHFPMWSLSEDDVARAVGRAQAIKELGQTLTAVLAREADSRSLGAELGLSPSDWLKAQAPGLDGSQAAALALLGKAFNDERWAALAAKVTRGAASVAQAAVVVRLYKDVERIADRQHLDDIVDEMVDKLEHFTLAELKGLAGQARAALKPPADADAAADRQRMGRSLSKVGKTAGLNEYRLRLDPEGSAILDGAIDPLARPRPDLGWTGDTTKDPRTPATRRADALLELIGRAVAAPEGQTRTPRAKVVITITLEALMEQLRGAGVASNGEVLPAATVRRMACEASLIPAFMGGPSCVLDLGAFERFFTPSQRLALALRDKGCSFPGCTIPPQWCEAHHCTHWLDGGPTDLSNGALLCGRHHTIVHQKGMTAIVTPDGVTWLLNGHPVRVTSPDLDQPPAHADQEARTRADLWAQRTPAAPDDPDCHHPNQTDPDPGHPGPVDLDPDAHGPDDDGGDRPPHRWTTCGPLAQASG